MPLRFCSAMCPSLRFWIDSSQDFDLAAKTIHQAAFHGKGQRPASDAHWKHWHPGHQETHSRKTPTCFSNPKDAPSPDMTPARNNKPTDGALRAAKQIEHNPSFLQSTADLIDRETGVREVLEILENIIAEAGDLIESRSPELAAQARAALRRYADEAPR